MCASLWGGGLCWPILKEIVTNRSMFPATEILLDAASGHDAQSWLILGGEAGLAVGLCDDHPDATVHWQPIDWRERSPAVNPPDNLRIDEPGATAADVDSVVIASTPDRNLARRCLLMARQALVVNGSLFIAGANTQGIRPVIGDAGKLFGPALREDYRSRQRVAVFAGAGVVDDPPAWASKPGVKPGTWEQYVLDVAGVSFSLVTQAGVFAGGRVDPGTRLLLDSLPNRLSGRVLDVGCGAGAIGVAAWMLRADAVDMTDVNLLAIQAAGENVRRLSRIGERRGSVPGYGPGAGAMRVFASDVYSACGDARYDLIVSNPPFHRGKAVDSTVAERLIDEAPNHLSDGGALLVVGNAFLAYGKRMESVFARVETVAATRQYHVLRASDPR